MRPIVTAARGLSVCLSYVVQSDEPCKTREVIDLSFVTTATRAPSEPCIRSGSVSPRGGAC